jgi:hypothetical protein
MYVTSEIMCYEKCYKTNASFIYILLMLAYAQSTLGYVNGVLLLWEILTICIQNPTDSNNLILTIMYYELRVHTYC